MRSLRPCSLGLRSLRLGAMCVLVGLMAACSIDPRPLSNQAIEDNIRYDQFIIRTNQQPVTGELDLAEAMARAVAYNLSHRVELMRIALAQGQLDLARFDLYPTLAASAGFDYRTPEDASISETIRSHIQSNEPAVSSDKFRTLADIRASWSVLDFGVSYLQAKQEADRLLIARGARVKIMRDLLMQVRRAYWAALASQRLRDRVVAAKDEALEALAEIDVGILTGAFLNNYEALVQKRRLLAVVQQLETTEQRLRVAEVQLASLINEPPGSPIRLADNGELPELPELGAPLEVLELYALTRSIDYRETIYSMRIEQQEARKALLRLLPGLEFGLSGNFDSNSYLEYNNWLNASMTVTWNLLRIASYPETQRINEARIDLAAMSRLATNMAVVTQVNVAARNYINALRTIQLARERADLDRQIAAIQSGAAEAASTGRIDMIQSKVDALQSDLASMQAYADAQEALGTLLNASGLDPVPENFNMLTLDQLAAYIRLVSQEIDSGEWMQTLVPYFNEIGLDYQALMSDRNEPGEVAPPTPDNAAIERERTEGTGTLLDRVLRFLAPEPQEEPPQPAVRTSGASV